MTTCSPVCDCSPATGGSKGSRRVGGWSTAWCCHRCSPSPPSPYRDTAPPCRLRPRDPLWARSVGPGWPPSPSQTDPSHSGSSRTRVHPRPRCCCPRTGRSLLSGSSAAYEPERWCLGWQRNSVLLSMTARYRLPFKTRIMNWCIFIIMQPWTPEIALCSS